MDHTTAHYDARTALQRQLDIAWSFANDFVIDRVDLSLAQWMPAPGSVTVHATSDGWLADWPDEEAEEVVAPATIGWLLWHIEWWWTNTLAAVAGEVAVPPTEFRWSGDTSHLVHLKSRWDEVLAGDDLDRLVQWMMPEAQPLGYIAGWVNFELCKNLAEINQLTMLHASQR